MKFIYYSLSPPPSSPGCSSATRVPVTRTSWTLSWRRETGRDIAAATRSRTTGSKSTRSRSRREVSATAWGRSTPRASTRPSSRAEQSCRLQLQSKSVGRCLVHGLVVWWLEWGDWWRNRKLCGESWRGGVGCREFLWCLRYNYRLVLASNCTPDSSLSRLEHIWEFCWEIIP